MISTSYKAAGLALLLLGASCTADQKPLPSAAKDGVTQAANGLASEAAASSPSSSNARVSEVATTIGEVMAKAHPGVIALSTEEAQWLSRNGYPSDRQLQELATYDAAKLQEQAHQDNNGTGAALWGLKLYENGDAASARAAFSLGASQGSLFAREQQAILELESRGPAEASNPSRLATFVARMEVAKLLGDHRADALIKEYAGNLDRKQFDSNILWQTGEFMRQYAADAQTRGKRAAGPDLRPNAKEWEALDTGNATAPVKVFERR